MNPTIEVVIMTHKRPNNLMPALRALRQQTTKPNRITVIDASEGEFRPPKEAFDLADRVFPSFGRGTFDRYVPVGMYSQKYTLFVDDDYTVMPSAIERMLKIAEGMESFGVMGMEGRLFGATRPLKYNFDCVRAHNVEVRAVDTVVRGALVLSQNLTSVVDYMWAMTEIAGLQEKIYVDDLLLCVAMSQQILETVLVYSPNTVGEKLIGNALPDAYAVGKRPEHLEERQNFLRLANDLGWATL